MAISGTYKPLRENVGNDLDVSEEKELQACPPCALSEAYPTNKAETNSKRSCSMVPSAHMPQIPLCGAVSLSLNPLKQNDNVVPLPRH